MQSNHSLETNPNWADADEPLHRLRLQPRHRLLSSFGQGLEQMMKEADDAAANVIYEEARRHLPNLDSFQENDSTAFIAWWRNALKQVPESVRAKLMTSAELLLFGALNKGSRPEPDRYYLK